MRCEKCSDAARLWAQQVGLRLKKMNAHGSASIKTVKRIYEYAVANWADRMDPVRSFVLLRIRLEIEGVSYKQCALQIVDSNIAS